MEFNTIYHQNICDYSVFDYTYLLQKMLEALSFILSGIWLHYFPLNQILRYKYSLLLNEIEKLLPLRFLFSMKIISHKTIPKKFNYFQLHKSKPPLPFTIQQHKQRFEMNWSTGTANILRLERRACIINKPVPPCYDSPCTLLFTSSNRLLPCKSSSRNHLAFQN